MPLPLRHTPVSNGAYAAELVQQQLTGLLQLRAPALALRRLRATVQQFGPALQLPDGISDQRLAKWERRLGLAHDLDVLRERLEEAFLPQLPKAELQMLRPVRKQLRRERQLAHGQVAELLRSRAYLEGLAQLQGWLKQPTFTALGQQPIRHWLVEWQAPVWAELLLHPGWQLSAAPGDAEVLRDLCRQIRQVCARLDNLAPLQAGRRRAWSGRFRQAQALLEEGNDLLLLQGAIQDQLPGRLDAQLPQLDWLLLLHQRQCWQQWRELVDGVLPLHCRQRLRRDLLVEPRIPGAIAWVKAGLRRRCGWFD